MNAKKRRYFLLGGFMLLIVALDQWTKYLTASRIPYGDQVPVLPGVFHLTFVRNTGAAFSMLSGMRWLFLVLVAVFFALVIYLIRKKFFTARGELWCLAAIGGGAVGNAIDRAVRGSVTDMIEVEFMRFAVFNVADIFITCGAVLLFLLILFGRRKEPSHEDPK